MFVRRDSQATTTRKIPAAIQACDESAWLLAERHATTAQTVWKWRKRALCRIAATHPTFSHTLTPFLTPLTPAQEAVADALRKT
ncbi:MAG: hypothetical protein OSA82_16055 [Paracoccaceae bacterium]|nr:hypothetical protein [Paracoccaceae bacterium]